MKIETRIYTKEVEERVYIASDGTEFMCEEDCRRYEYNNERCALFDLLYAIEHIDMYEKDIGGIIAERKLKPLDGEEYYDSYYYTWYKPKTLDELKIISEYFFEDKSELDPSLVGKWIYIESPVSVDDIPHSDNPDIYIGRLEDSVLHIKDFLKIFGLKAEIKNVETNNP